MNGISITREWDGLGKPFQKGQYLNRDGNEQSKGVRTEEMGHTKAHI